MSAIIHCAMTVPLDIQDEQNSCASTTGAQVGSKTITTYARQKITKDGNSEMTTEKNYLKCNVCKLKLITLPDFKTRTHLQRLDLFSFFRQKILQCKNKTNNFKCKIILYIHCHFMFKIIILFPNYINNFISDFNTGH